ncbi:unnamed protein product [Amoebophrya sp. A25]|nr:unnamed protein product [Amoebophrya sp. A25]|eukprot:GSA25T00003507001.1
MKTTSPSHSQGAVVVPQVADNVAPATTVLNTSPTTTSTKRASPTTPRTAAAARAASTPPPLTPHARPSPKESHFHVPALFQAQQAGQDETSRGREYSKTGVPLLSPQQQVSLVTSAIDAARFAVTTGASLTGTYLYAPHMYSSSSAASAPNSPRSMSKDPASPGTFIIKTLTGGGIVPFSHQVVVDSRITPTTTLNSGEKLVVDEDEEDEVATLLGSALNGSSGVPVVGSPEQKPRSASADIAYTRTGRAQQLFNAGARVLKEKFSPRSHSALRVQLPSMKPVVVPALLAENTTKVQRGRSTSNRKKKGTRKSEDEDGDGASASVSPGGGQQDAEAEDQDPALHHFHDPSHQYDPSHPLHALHKHHHHHHGGQHYLSEADEAYAHLCDKIKRVRERIRERADQAHGIGLVKGHEHANINIVEEADAEDERREQSEEEYERRHPHRHHHRQHGEEAAGAEAVAAASTAALPASKEAATPLSPKDVSLSVSAQEQPLSSPKQSAQSRPQHDLHILERPALLSPDAHTMIVSHIRSSVVVRERSRSPENFIAAAARKRRRAPLKQESSSSSSSSSEDEAEQPPARPVTAMSSPVQQQATSTSQSHPHPPPSAGNGTNPSNGYSARHLLLAAGIHPRQEQANQPHALITGHDMHDASFAHNQLLKNRHRGLAHDDDKAHLRGMRGGLGGAIFGGPSGRPRAAADEIGFTKRRNLPGKTLVSALPTAGAFNEAANMTAIRLPGGRSPFGGARAAQSGSGVGVPQTSTQSSSSSILGHARSVVNSSKKFTAQDLLLPVDVEKVIANAGKVDLKTVNIPKANIKVVDHSTMNSSKQTTYKNNSGGGYNYPSMTKTGETNIFREVDPEGGGDVVGTEHHDPEPQYFSAGAATGTKTSRGSSPSDAASRSKQPKQMVQASPRYTDRSSRSTGTTVYYGDSNIAETRARSPSFSLSNLKSKTVGLLSSTHKMLTGGGRSRSPSANPEGESKEIDPEEKRPQKKNRIRTTGYMQRPSTGVGVSGTTSGGADEGANQGMYNHVSSKVDADAVADDAGENYSSYNRVEDKIHYQEVEAPAENQNKKKNRIRATPGYMQTRPSVANQEGEHCYTNLTSLVCNANDACGGTSVQQQRNGTEENQEDPLTQNYEDEEEVIQHWAPASTSIDGGEAVGGDEAPAVPFVVGGGVTSKDTDFGAYDHPA